MYKFYFARTREPMGPSWNNRREAPELSRVRPELRPVVQHHFPHRVPLHATVHPPQRRVSRDLADDADHACVTRVGERAE